MHITFISTGSYPDVHAASIRHSLLARGLAEKGHHIQFMLLNPQNWKGKKALDYFGVEFIELNHYNGSVKLLQHFHYLRALLKARRLLRNKARNKTLDAFFVHAVMAIHFIPMIWLIKQVKKTGVPVFHERTELPYVFGIDQRLLNIYLNRMLPLFTGIFVISDKLVTYFKQYNSNVTKLVTVVDMSFFHTTAPSPYPFPYIGYCGTIGGTKDGVPILIAAFGLMRQQFKGLKLVLVGNNSKRDDIRDTLEAIENAGLEEEVLFTGLVDREMMPVILCNASILVVAKPDTEQNSGNFPIKIGEYLATGVPVVVTGVGEIPQFIKDGDSGFLAEPNNAEAFAQKMAEALEDKERAAKIGNKGREIAATYFDYQVVAFRMAEEMAKIISQEKQKAKS